MVPPIAEQKRIVEKIDSLTTRTAHARADLDRIQSLALKYKARIIELGCAGDLTSVWRASKSYPKPRRVRLGDVAQSFNYGTSSKSAPEGDVPVLRMGNIQNGRLDWVNLVYTSNSAEIEKYRLENGDVLFNRTNSPELVGKTAVYKGERKAIFAGYLIRVKCGPKLLPDYLSHCLNGPAGRRYSWDVKRDSVSQSNINAKKLANFEFLLPTLDEQSEIVNLIETALSWLDRVSADHAVVTELLPKLDAAILSKAFCGELVPQDPNDVSAHKLLVQTNEEMETLKAEPRYRQKTLSSRKPIRRKTTMTDLIEVLESRKGWISASDTARELGIGDGSTSDEVEKFYGKLRECVLDGSITVERRDDEDWLRLQSTKVA
ncbi:MAG: type I restriction endonuclease subunit S [Hyphomicrobiales bacterium]|nr:MAG: type I restriction endonuclease subunit S [Hyphomicrobiales bacterium]